MSNTRTVDLFRRLIKTSVPLILLLVPYWGGMILHLVRLKAAHMIVAGLLPQYLLYPPLSYFNTDGTRALDSSLGATSIIVAWAILLAFHAWIGWKRSFRYSFVLFVILFSTFLLLGHVALDLSGYDFLLDAP